MSRHLFIVSRRNPELYEYLKIRFADDDRVEVILDRRQGKLREPEGDVSGGARHEHDRRSRPAIERELETASHVIVSLES